MGKYTRVYLSKKVLEMEVSGEYENVLCVLAHLYNMGLSKEDIAKLIESSEYNVKQAFTEIGKLGMLNKKQHLIFKRLLYRNKDKSSLPYVFDYDKIVKLYDKHKILEYNGDIYLRINKKEVEKVINFINRFSKLIKGNEFIEYVLDFKEKLKKCLDLRNKIKR